MSRTIGIVCATFALWFIAMGWEGIWSNPVAATLPTRSGWSLVVLAAGILPAVVFRLVNHIGAATQQARATSRESYRT